jgi:hypothetical protein
MNVLDVMGDFMNPETLARVAKVSKAAHSFITPILERKRADKNEMYQMLLRMFPGIRNLQDGRNASYYNTLIQTYFEPRVRVPMPVEIGHMIGLGMKRTRKTMGAVNITEVIRQASQTRIPNPSLAGEMCNLIRSAMNSAEGRRRLKQSIRDWEAALQMHVDGLSLLDVYSLRIIDDCVRLDFSIRNDNIGI